MTHDIPKQIDEIYRKSTDSEPSDNDSRSQKSEANAAFSQTLSVLEDLRDMFHEEGMESEAKTINEAHCLVQEYTHE